ncbi:hypothetical protein KIPB_016156 [Kipferlia bialata]|uniref:Uncharacterized protein n=1 Tax=Kipferlia bialata TaxID=797122 RepID=A0A391NX09_9EUKA|nr:hypothetical protein KIPB_016156 [Kipferlia bialata]|eukprot:g16156.t1
MCSVGESFVSFRYPNSVSVSLAGKWARTQVVLRDTVSGPHPSRYTSFQVAVYAGPFICLFGSHTEDTLEDGDAVTHCVYMYDRVSGDATLCVSLPHPDEVVSACMLNPTTMLVLQEERTLVLELDPELFNIYTDVD